MSGYRSSRESSASFALYKARANGGGRAESVLLLSDGTPQPVLSALDEMYPSASKVSISKPLSSSSRES